MTVSIILFLISFSVETPELRPVHSSHSYKSAKAIFFSNNFLKYKSRIVSLEQKCSNMNVFVSLYDDKHFNYFFHKNHVIYEILWSSDALDGPEKTHIIKNLKLWHVSRYNITLDAQLYDMVDVEAWFERL